VHAHRGEADQAVAAFEAAGRLDDSPWAAAWLGYGYGLAKRRLEAGRVLARLKASSAEGCEVAFFDALVYAGLKDHARALDSLDRACAERSLAFSVAAHLPAFEDLRHDPRFQHVLRRYAQRAAADTEAAAPEEGHS
jgi:tetratricopeptide (TPR) repeat protein